MTLILVKFRSIQRHREKGATPLLGERHIDISPLLVAGYFLESRSHFMILLHPNLADLMREFPPSFYFIILAHL